jgi:hypothetical protein
MEVLAMLLAMVARDYGFTFNLPAEDMVAFGRSLYNAAREAEEHYREHPEAFIGQMELLKDYGHEREGIDFIMGFLAGAGITFQSLTSAKWPEESPRLSILTGEKPPTEKN